MALKLKPLFGRPREDLAFWTLIGLIAAAFLMGGGGRDDLLSLPILRPLSAVALILGLYHLRAEDIRPNRAVFLMLGATIGLIAVHLIPLPPSLWSALPGRELVVEAGEVAGIEQPWRPIALVPWRGWNALFAMQVPAAALVLAAVCRPDQQRRLVSVVLALGLLSVVLGMLQAISGYREGLHLYAITNEQSPNGLFANRNHQAAMICAMLPLLVVFATSGVRKSDIRLRGWLAAVAGAAMFLVLLISGSRAGIVLGLVALAAVGLLQSRGGGWGAKSRNRLFFLGLLAGGSLLLVLVAATFLNIGGLERLLNVEEESEVRLQAWPVIIRMIGEYFPVGSGIGSFVEVYKLHEPAESLSAQYLNHAHNDFLEWVLDGGFPAMLLILAAVLGWALKTRSAWLRFQRNPQEGRLRLAGSSVILILGLASLVDYPLRVPSLAVLAVLAAVWMGGAEPHKVSRGGFGREERLDAHKAAPRAG